MPLVKNVTGTDLDVPLIGRHFAAGETVDVPDADAELLASNANFDVAPASPSQSSPVPAAPTAAVTDAAPAAAQNKD